MRMKKLLLLIPAAALLWAACSNDFDVTAPWKEIPVVYAIISPKDTAYYVRVEKAFLDPEKSAAEIAQIPDSLYYPPSAITVYLERKSNGQRYQMTRVDGNLEGYVREAGFFANQPNWLYKFKPADATQQLQEGETCRLVIVRADGKPDITAETTLPGTFRFQKPNQQSIPPLIAFGPNSPTTFEWRCDENGVYFNLDMLIQYREQTPSGQFLARKTLRWPVFKNQKRNTSGSGGAFGFSGSAKISANQFYQFLTDSIQPASESCGGCYRFFEGIDLLLEGGGKEIENYLITANANEGLTGAEVLPSYTNISEGFGIFTGKNQHLLTGCRVSTQTVDSMATHPTVGLLNFKN